MYSTVKTAVLSGIEAIPVCVEVDISTGMPVFDMVGNITSVVLGALVAVAALSPLSAKSTARTVEQIKKSKTIKIAVFSDKKPYVHYGVTVNQILQ